jgi:hypothetical protein
MTIVEAERTVTGGGAPNGTTGRLDGVVAQPCAGTSREQRVMGLAGIRRPPTR